MPEKKEDRRTRYSKRVIREALFTLMQEKPLNKISVTEICETADVNRSTFYAYYQDIYDLHTGIIREFYLLQREYMNQTLAFLQDKGDITSLSIAEFREIAALYLQNVKENKEIYKFIFNGNSMTEILSSFYKVFFAELRKKVPPEMHEHFRHSFRFVSGGTSQTMTAWLAGDCAEPVERLARYLGYYYNGIFNGRQFAGRRPDAAAQNPGTPGSSSGAGSPSGS